jgi:hypothetical protein
MIPLLLSRLHRSLAEVIYVLQLFDSQQLSLQTTAVGVKVSTYASVGATIRRIAAPAV